MPRGSSGHSLFTRELSIHVGSPVSAKWNRLGGSPASC